MAALHTPDALQLAELLATRLCHELAGPAGALAGTLELASEDRDFETVATAHEQAQLLVARLRLLRAAWGGGEALDAAELRVLLAALPRAARVRTDLDRLDPDASFPPLAARALLNALLLAAESLPRGGRVALASTVSGTVISLHGQNAAWPASLAAMLGGDFSWTQVDARHLQAPLTVLVARAAGVGLTLAAGGPGEDAASLLIGPDQR